MTKKRERTVPWDFVILRARMLLLLPNSFSKNKHDFICSYMKL